MEITREQLQELQWAASSYPEDARCPVCHAFEPTHDAGCWIAEKLKAE